MRGENEKLMKTMLNQQKSEEPNYHKVMNNFYYDGRNFEIRPNLIQEENHPKLESRRSKERGKGLSSNKLKKGAYKMNLLNVMSVDRLFQNIDNLM